MTWFLNCLYLLAGALLLPLWLLKLPRAQRYRAGLLQRLGLSPRLPPDSPRLWIHCASVGEAAIPRRVVAELRGRFPQWDIVFSTNTDTGAARLLELYPGSTVFYMPLDFSPCVAAALDRVRPDAVLLVELELWPNFIARCHGRGVPVGIINGRMGRNSRRLLGLAARLWRSLWDPVAVCCARSEDDAAGFLQAGLPAERVHNCGMLKCDGLVVEPDPDRQQHLRRLFAIRPQAPVIVAGSTHQGEETALAAVYKDLKIKHRNLRMVVAPRHIERGSAVATALRARGLSVETKQALEAGGRCSDREAVIVLDTIGDLVSCYGLATCVFVGRSLLPPGGGQNVLEPAALAKPVLTGPHTQNFRPEMSLLLEAGAAVVVHSRRELVRQFDRLLSNPREARRIGHAGRRIIEQGRGATECTVRWIRPMLAAASAATDAGRRAV